jgi:hypothetical protein
MPPKRKAEDNAATSTQPQRKAKNVAAVPTPQEPFARRSDGAVAVYDRVKRETSAGLQDRLSWFTLPLGVAVVAPLPENAFDAQLIPNEKRISVTSALLDAFLKLVRVTDGDAQFQVVPSERIVAVGALPELADFKAYVARRMGHQVCLRRNFGSADPDVMSWGTPHVVTEDMLFQFLDAARLDPVDVRSNFALSMLRAVARYRQFGVRTQYLRIFNLRSGLEYTADISDDATWHNVEAFVTNLVADQDTDPHTDTRSLKPLLK